MTSVVIDNIRPELKNRVQWVCWRVENRDGQLVKVPIDPQTGTYAKTNTPRTWTSFEDAVAACDQYNCAGIGYVFVKGDPFVGIDLDKCRDPDTGVIEPWAQAIVTSLNSYTEISPSGRGLHIIAHGGVPSGLKQNGVEIYDDHRYFTVTGQHLDGTPLTIEDRCEAVTALYHQHAKASKHNGTSHNGHLNGSTPILAGARNNTLTSLAGSMRQKGFAPEAILAALLAENQARCQPPLPDSEVAAIAKSISKYEPSPTLYNRTDYGNAERFVRRHGLDVRYCSVFRQWLVWNSGHWVLGRADEVIRLAKDTVRYIANDATLIEQDDDRKALLLWSLKSESADAIRKMLKLAESEPDIPITPDVLDRDPWLLNCANGTLDLRTGTLREPRREDLLTKRLTIAYDPAATCPTFLHFLSTIMGGNEDLIAFLQRAIGYALTGRTQEQVLFLFYGTGANGKSTLLLIVLLLLADYAKQASFTSFLASDQERVRNDLAALRGARFVSAIEVEEGRRLSEVVVKQVTGGDPITARFLFAEYFTYVPTFKLFLACNHKPVIRGTDHAIWRRIHLVPFTVTIPAEKQDKHLLDKLTAELTGILAWAVQGCLLWQRHGLAVPKIVTDETKEYRSEMDVLGAFLDECCIETKQSRVANGVLYARFKQWADTNEEWIMSQKLFALKLKERGFQSFKGHASRGWQGLQLREQAEPGVQGHLSEEF